ncbi:MAG: SPOR domain-containing protein [Limnochordaceae bacterium]|nr:SPOR domain-containing protein [Limnochordaceae bacterium]
MHAGRHRIKGKKKPADAHRELTVRTPMDATPAVSSAPAGEEAGVGVEEVAAAGSGTAAADWAASPVEPAHQESASQRVAERRSGRTRRQARGGKAVDSSTRVTMMIVALIASVLLGYYVAVRWLMPPSEPASRNGPASSGSSVASTLTGTGSSDATTGRGAVADGQTATTAAGETGAGAAPAGTTALGGGDTAQPGTAPGHGTAGGATASGSTTGVLPPLDNAGALPSVSLPVMGQTSAVQTKTRAVKGGSRESTSAGAVGSQNAAADTGGPSQATSASNQSSSGHRTSTAVRSQGGQKAPSTSESTSSAVKSSPAQGTTRAAAGSHPASLHRVVLGVVESQEQAQELLSQAKQAGYKDAFIQANPWRVQVGAFRELQRAQNLVTELKQKGFAGAEVFEPVP